MADIQEILGRQINSVKELKSAIKELQDSLVGLDTESQEYKDTATKLIAAQDALKDTTRAGVEANTAAKDSIVGLQKEYNKLYDAYKKLSDEQRNSDIGKGMAESLEKLSTSINNSKKEVGNFTSNIGRYAQGATEAFSQMGISIGALQTPMKLASGGAKTLGASLKALIANPVGAVIMAIVVAMKALHAIAERVKKAINDNEDSSNRLKVAMATFKPVLDAVSNAFDFLAKIVVNVIEGLAKVAEKIMSIIPGMKQAIQSHKDLAKATNDLTKATREANIENSKKTAEIERLREEASATEDVTEKKRLLEEAKAMQAEVDQKNIELAQEELRIQEEYAAKTANSAEENEKLAAAQKKVNDAIAQGERNASMYNKQLGNLTNTTGAATSAGKNYREEAKKLHEQLLDDNKTEIQKLTEKYEKEKKLLEKYHYDTKLLTKKYEQERSEIMYQEWKKRADRQDTAYDNYFDNQVRFYENQKKTTGELEAEKNKAKDALDMVIAFKNKINDAVSQIIPGPIGEVPRKIYEIFLKYGDFLKNADFDFAKGMIERFKFDDEDLKERVMIIFESLGKEGWARLWRAFEVDAKELAKYGVNIKNQLDFTPAITELEQKLLELNTEITKRNSEIANVGTELDAVLNDTWKNYLELVELNQREALEAEKNALYDEIINFKGAEDQKLELLKRYYAIAQELRDKDMQAVQLNAQRIQEVMDSALDFSSSIEGMINGVEQLMQAEIQSGKLTEKEAARKQKALENLQKIQLGVAIANIAANTAAGIMDVWRGYSSELVLNAQTAAAAGPGAAISKAALDAKSLASAILRTSTLAMQGGSQIAAAVGGYISKGSAGAEGQDVGVGATPALIDTTPYTYSRTVQTTEEEDRLNAPIFVTVTDIEEGLGHKATVTNESSF